MAPEKDKQLIYKKIREYLQTLEQSKVPVWRLYLYGSYAKDTYHADSDIDLAVFWDREETLTGSKRMSCSENCPAISICGSNPIPLPVPISTRRTPTSKKLSKPASESFNLPTIIEIVSRDSRDRCSRPGRTILNYRLEPE